jgi:hypothetical protein
VQRSINSGRRVVEVVALRGGGAPFEWRLLRVEVGEVLFFRNLGDPNLPLPTQNPTPSPLPSYIRSVIGQSNNILFDC